MNNFYLTLLSDSSLSTFSKNTQCDFKVKLDHSNKQTDLKHNTKHVQLCTCSTKVPSISLNSKSSVRIMSGLNMFCVTFFQDFRPHLAKISLLDRSLKL